MVSRIIQCLICVGGLTVAWAAVWVLAEPEASSSAWTPPSRGQPDRVQARALESLSPSESWATSRSPAPRDLPPGEGPAPEATMVSALPAGESPVLRGRTIDGEGAPVAGATLLLAPLEFLEVGAQGQPQEGVEVYSDASGFFSHPGPEVPQLVLAKAVGYEPALVEYHPGAADLTLTLKRHRVVSGRVVTPQGESLGAGVVVTARSPTAWSGEVVVETDGAGRFTLSGLGAGAWELTARGEGLASRRPLILPAGSERSDLLVEVEPGNEVLVHAIDSSAHAVSGARVRLLAVGEGPLLRHTDLESTTDPQGQARLGAVAPGSYVLSLEHETHASVREPLEVGPVAEGVAQVTLELLAGATLELRLLSAEGDPESGRIVALIPKGALSRAVATTDEDGLCSFTGLESGIHHLQMLADPTGSAEGLTPIGEVTLREGKTEELKLRLPSTLLRARLTGRVLSSDGPRAGVRVQLAPEEADGEQGWIWLTTDEEGEFNHPDLVPGSYRVSVEGADDRQIHLLPGGEDRVEIWPEPDSADSREGEATSSVLAEGSRSLSEVLPGWEWGPSFP